MKETTVLLIPWRTTFYNSFLTLQWFGLVKVFGASNPESCSGISESEVKYIRQQQQLDQQEEHETGHSFAQVEITSSTEGESDSEAEQDQGLSHHGPNYHKVHTSDRLSDEIRSRVGPSSSSSTAFSGPIEFGDRQPSVIPDSTEPVRWTLFRNRTRSRVMANTTKTPFCNAWGFFIMQSWLPTFYLDFYGVDVGKIGYLSVVPSIAQGIFGFIAGYLGDKAIQEWSCSSLLVRRASQAIGSVGLGASLVLAVTLAPSAVGAMTIISFGMALNGFTMIGATAYPLDICPRHAGFIFSLGNTAATIPGLIGIMLVGGLLEQHGSNRWGLIWSL
ncbi:hypothetical protein BGZ94_005327, partial [Podila epigama]